MAGISDRAIKTNYAENKNRYNRKELQSKEFSDGSGLEEYDYGARFYDPQIARWSVIDPKSERFNSMSTYQFCMDNPLIYVDPIGMENIIYLVGVEGVNRNQLRKIRKQVNQNFKDLGLKTRAEIFKGKAFTKDFYQKMDKHDAVAIIGNTNAVTQAVKALDKKMADYLQKDPDFGPKGKANPEISGNPHSDNNSNDNIIAVNMEDAKDQGHDFKVSLEEGIAFDITHGAGHNSSLGHGGSVAPEGNDNRVIPKYSVMASGDEIMNGILVAPLSGYITTKANQGVVTDHYKARFGDNAASSNKNIPITNEKDK